MSDETRIFVLGVVAGFLLAAEGAILFVWKVYL